MKLLLIGFLFISHISLAQNNQATIEVKISETSSDDGVIQLLIFNQDKGWPESLDEAWQMMTLPIENGIAKKTIPNVPAGNYAITVFHDHDEDGEIRKNKIGYPVDSFGFSNNPSLLFGVPSFEKCSQKVTGDKAIVFEIKLR